MQLLLGNKPYLPYIRSLDTHQHRLIKLSLVAGKGFEKVLYSGVYKFDARRPFQQFFCKLHQPADNKRRRNISHNQRYPDKNDKAQPRYPPGRTKRIHTDQVREEIMDKIWQDTIHPLKSGYYKENSDGNGRQDQQPLQKKLEQRAGYLANGHV